MVRCARRPVRDGQRCGGRAPARRRRGAPAQRHPGRVPDRAHARHERAVRRVRGRDRRRASVPPARHSAGQEEPVTYVTWNDARAFCEWAGAALPSEAQWERAARGDDERTWPWGDQLPDAWRCSFESFEGPPAVGATPEGASPFGALDLAGTVWEWTSTAYRPYPYDAIDGREDPSAFDPRVVRGGSFIHGAGAIRCSARHPLHPGARDHYVGFRVAAGPAPGPLALDWVDVPAGEVQLGNDPRPRRGEARPDEVPQTRRRARGLRAVARARDERAVRLLRRRPRRPGPATLGRRRTARRIASVIRSRSSTGTMLVPSVPGSGAGCRRRPSGRRPHEAPTRAPIPGVTSSTTARSTPASGAKHGATSAVDAHPAGASPYGLLDMAGNVWEWVSSAYRAVSVPSRRRP